jgi:hypothetical protein
MSNELTVCTVSFHSAPFVMTNIRLTSKLNPRISVKWIVAENSPANSLHKMPSKSSCALEPDVHVIDGVEGSHIPTYHHSLALLKCVEQARTRFILVLDPDFFVIKSDWVRIVTQYMRECELAILGVPWHPRHDKYRYFPAVHFCLFDTQRFAKGEIDFRPDYPDGDNDTNWPCGRDAHRRYFAKSRIAQWLGGLPLPVIRHRRVFHTDTGSRLYKKYARDAALKFEILDPVYDRTADGRNLSYLGKLLDSILPDDLCYRPKGYKVSEASFVPRLVADDSSRLWEEFTWKGAPFGFHVRLNMDRHRRDYVQEAAAIETIANRIGDRQSESLSNFAPDSAVIATDDIGLRPQHD